MSFVKTDIQGQIMIIKLNRPERLNALSKVIREGMADAFNQFKNDKDLEVAILTGEGRGFCAGEDMKESLEIGELASAPGKGDDNADPFMNGELDKLESFLSSFVERLSIGGRITIISFHSLEDRMVKHSFKRLAKDGFLSILTKKPLIATAEEMANNRRSKSAKLRAAERIA